MARGTRPRKHRIEVWCNEDEFTRIKATAQITRLSGSEYLRTLGAGYEPKSRFDSEAINKLAQLHADQGRLGGLLKLWLSEKKDYGGPAHRVRSLLQEIESLQTYIAKLVTQEARQL